jgi:rfaE bifunctional protein nucleotidyltransferase chain/domain
MDAAQKVVTLDRLIDRLGRARKSGKQIVFTNGCFDILHVGHVRYLAAARSEGDLLVIGLNSDDSVRVIKGEHRPIVSQHQRAEVLANLGCVDYVILFDEPDPRQLIETLKPNILVKGADWAEEDIIGAEFVKASGGKIVRIKFVDEISTSAIIERILAKYSGKLQG